MTAVGFNNTPEEIRRQEAYADLSAAQKNIAEHLQSAPAGLGVPTDVEAGLAAASALLAKDSTDAVRRWRNRLLDLRQQEEQARAALAALGSSVTAEEDVYVEELSASLPVRPPTDSVDTDAFRRMVGKVKADLHRAGLRVTGYF